MSTLERQRVFTLIAIFAVIFSCPIPASAVLYHFVDNAGVHHFTNVPDDPRFQPYGLSSSRRYSKAQGSKGLDNYIKNAANRNNLDARLIKAIIKVESNFNPRAISPKGARGLMQLMPATMKMLNVSNPFDPAENIHAGSRYLRMLLDTFHDQLSLSLAAYNAGPALVKSKGRIPEIKETKNYVKKVLATYRDYRR